MKLKIPRQITDILVKLKPLTKHLYFAALLLVLLGLAGVTYSVNQVLSAPSDSAYLQQKMSATIGSKFNKSTQDTIDRVEALQKSTDTAGKAPVLPPGRINPFSE